MYLALSKYHLLHNFHFLLYIALNFIYTLSLHDALPIFIRSRGHDAAVRTAPAANFCRSAPSSRSRPIAAASAAESPGGTIDRKSTRLNSSHLVISYAVFCLKKKKIG